MTAVRKQQSDEAQRREMRFRPRSLDENEMTVVAVVATETLVSRWFGEERLICSEDAIDTTRLIGLPLLDSHNRGTAFAVLGRVEAFKIDGRKLICTIRFADTDRGREAFALVKDGMLSRMSVGYHILDFTDSRASDGTNLRSATRWLPIEVSLVGVPADHNAKIRGLSKMAKAARRAAAPSRQAPVPPVDDHDDDLDNIDFTAVRSQGDDVDETVSRAELDRIDDVRVRALEQGIDPLTVARELRGVTSAREARDRLFAALARRSDAVRVNPTRTENRVAPDQTREFAIEALSERLGAATTLSEQNARRGMSIAGIVRTRLQSQNIRTEGMRDHEVVERAFNGGFAGYFSGARGMHTTSDFSDLLMDAGVRALMERFHAMAPVLKMLSTKKNATDFRPKSFIRPGEAADLDVVSESGEVKYGTMATEKQGFVLESYGKMFSISRKALINDDLGAFADFISAFAESAARTEAKLFHSLLSANSYAGIALSDGQPLFHADHGNLAGAGTVIDVTNVGLARKAMREQKNVAKSDVAGTPPAILLVGPAKQTEAEMVVAQISAATVGDVNPFGGKLTVAVEDRIAGSNWYLFGDPKIRPAFVHGYLDGSEGPRVETREGWNQLGTEFRCLLDFGCGVYDWRAAYRNPGA